MSDFETVALIVVFLVLSLIIVRLIGGDADNPVKVRGAKRTAQPPPALRPAVAEPVTTAGRSPDEAAVTVVTKPAVAPVEAAMVKTDLPKPAAIKSTEAQSSAQSSARPTEAITATTTASAASYAAKTTQAEAAPVAPLPPPIPAKPAGPAAVAAAPVTPAAAAGTVRPDANATIQPGATPAARTPAWTSPASALSPEEQAIVSRYLRPDVKATLYHAPPPGSVPAPAPVQTPVYEPLPPLKPLPPRSAQPPAPSGPSPVLPPRVAATLPPGYEAAAPAAAPQPFEPSTGFAPLGVVPDARATIEGGSAAIATLEPTAPAAHALSAQASVVEVAPEATSPRAVRAATIPPSSAVKQVASSAPTQSETAATSGGNTADTVLLSTAKRGTRVIGTANDELEPIDLTPPLAPRPQTPSIWSSSYPRPSVAYTLPLGIDAVLQVPGVRAERIPVRAETVLVRRGSDASGAASYTASAAAASAKASLDKSGIQPSVHYTLPPGALGEE